MQYDSEKKKSYSFSTGCHSTENLLLNFISNEERNSVKCLGHQEMSVNLQQQLAAFHTKDVSVKFQRQV